MLFGGLTLHGIVVGMTAVALLAGGRGLPAWFIALFVTATAALEWALVSYVGACWRGRLKEPVELDRTAVATLLLAVLAFAATSSLHNFHPFRPWSGEPPRPMLRFNFALTAAALVAAATLAAGYAAGFRRAAVVGMAALAVALLVPNDNCANAFNRPWLRTLGASPLMFAPASVGLLVAACGLCQLWRRTSLVIVLTICLGTLLVGVGHMTRVIW